MATTLAPLIVTVRAVEISRHPGLHCEGCGEDRVIGVVYALKVDDSQVDVGHYRRCSDCHEASEEPFDVPDVQ